MRTWEQNYLHLRSLTERGQYEKAAALLRAFRESSESELRALRVLISARIAIKSSGTSVEPAALDPKQVQDPFLRAELHFTRGILHFHGGQFAEGIRDFEFAGANYEKLGAGFTDRRLLSAFNAYAGHTNLDPLPSPEESLEELRDVERMAFESKNRKIMGLVLREKSGQLQILGKFRAALEDARQSARLLELYGPKSDHALALVQVADCALDIDAVSGRGIAEAALDRIVLPIDQRIEFPLAMVRARLAGKPLGLSNFTVIVPCDRAKWERQFGLDQAKASPGGWLWQISEQRAVRDGKKIRLKKESMEGKLLQLLLRAPQEKSRLAETLWPEHCSSPLLDNRLHRLISRTNRKMGDLIQYNGRKYRLAESVEVQ